MKLRDEENFLMDLIKISLKIKMQTNRIMKISTSTKINFKTNPITIIDITEYKIAMKIETKIQTNLAQQIFKCSLKNYPNVKH
jgi:hypothetical protein